LHASVPTNGARLCSKYSSLVITQTLTYDRQVYEREILMERPLRTLLYELTISPIMQLIRRIRAALFTWTAKKVAICVPDV